MPGSQKAFSETLKRREFTIKKGSKGVRMFLGIRLKPAPESVYG